MMWRSRDQRKRIGTSEHFPEIRDNGNRGSGMQMSITSCNFYNYTQRNLFEILLDQLEIRLYLPFSDWFWSKRTSVWIQINRRAVNTIWFRVDLIRFLHLNGPQSQLYRLSTSRGSTKGTSLELAVHNGITEPKRNSFIRASTVPRSVRLSYCRCKMTRI